MIAPQQFREVLPKIAPEDARGSLPESASDEAATAPEPVSLNALGEPMLTVDRAGFEALTSPIVYAWLDGDEWLYVGQSAVGISRPINVSHHRLRFTTDSQRLLIWRAPSLRAALDIEAELIRVHAPRLNGPAATIAVCVICNVRPASFANNEVCGTCGHVMVKIYQRERAERLEQCFEEQSRRAAQRRERSDREPWRVWEPLGPPPPPPPKPEPRPDPPSAEEVAHLTALRDFRRGRISLEALQNRRRQQTALYSDIAAASAEPIV